MPSVVQGSSLHKVALGWICEFKTQYQFSRGNLLSKGVNIQFMNWTAQFVLEMMICTLMCHQPLWNLLTRLLKMQSKLLPLIKRGLSIFFPFCMFCKNETEFLGHLHTFYHYHYHYTLLLYNYIVPSQQMFDGTVYNRNWFNLKN